jgi:cell division protease FtsH
VGADLQNLVNEAALLAARRDASRVGMIDFEMAKDKVLLGAERRSLIMSDEDKRIIAYHEAGHALVAVLSEHADPVHKVTIIPRGTALGVTWTFPVEDRFSLTSNQMLARIKHAMGGRAAEKMVFDHLSTGAANDLQQATQLAREMVCKYGMSDAIGPVSYDSEGTEVFLGRDFATHKTYSEKTAEGIDAAVAGMLNGLYEEARQLLLENREVLDRIADALLERETLEGADLDRILAGEPLPPMPSPIASAAEEEATPQKTPARSEDMRGGGKLPDPEPVPS